MDDGLVLWHFTMSLDGFLAGPHHDMSFLAHASHEPGLTDGYARRTGAVLGGRRAHDAWIGVEDELFGGGWQIPEFVLTHHPEDALPRPGVTILSCDLAEAVAICREAADGKNVEILSADLGRQCLERGLVDEVHVHVAPVLLGDGVRVFDRPGGVPLPLTRIRHGGAPTAAASLYFVPAAPSGS